MAYTSLGFTKDRGNYNTKTSLGVAWHTYDTNADDFDTIILPGYFPSFIGLSRDDVKINDLILTQDKTKLIRVYRVINLDPLTIEIAMSNIGEVKYVVYPAETNTASEGHRIVQVTSNSDFEFNFAIPLDFVSIESMDTVGWPQSTPSVSTIDLTSNYSTEGEDINTHSESVVDAPFPLIDAKEKFLCDVSRVLTGVQAGDTGSITIKHNNIGTNVAYLMVELYYRTS